MELVIWNLTFYMVYSHVPVLPEEIIHYLKLSPGHLVIDCTLGGGGHSRAILKRISPKGRMLGIDLDPLAISAAEKQLKKYKKQITLVQDNFKNLKKISDVYKFNKVDAILLDLGLSSGQLQDHGRGFSFLAQGRLDMRFGQSGELTAGKIINTYGREELTEIFKKYGEEKLASLIAKKIIAIRKEGLITSPNQLVGIVSDVYKRHYRGKSKINPATKIFQALRIEVNKEFENLEEILPQAAGLLKKGGRLAVISYHSLEDKIVKDFFKQESRDCLCPPKLPVCRCGHEKSLKIITKKPVSPTENEVNQNPRARSAKLRVAERI